MKSDQVFSVFAALLCFSIFSSIIETREVPSLPVDIKDHCLGTYHHDRAHCLNSVNFTHSNITHFFNHQHDLQVPSDHHHHHLHPSMLNNTVSNGEHCCPLWSWVDCVKDAILVLEASNSTCPSTNLLSMLKKDEGKIMADFGCTLEITTALKCNLKHTDDGKSGGLVAAGVHLEVKLLISIAIFLKLFMGF